MGQRGVTRSSGGANAMRVIRGRAWWAKIASRASPSSVYHLKFGVGRPALKSLFAKKKTRAAQPIFGNSPAGIFQRGPHASRGLAKQGSTRVPGPAFCCLGCPNCWPLRAHAHGRRIVMGRDGAEPCVVACRCPLLPAVSIW